MQKLCPALLTLALLATEPVLARTANTDASKVDAGCYLVDPSHTQVSFDVLHMGFTYYEGRFSAVAGELELKPKDVAGSTVHVVVQTASVGTTSEKLDGELRGADWLDAQKFPTIDFKSTSVTPTGQGGADVTGDLTLHGVTKPLTLHVRFVGSGTNPLDKKYTAGFSMSGMLKRSDFGVTKYLPMIGDEVEMEINGAFEKKQ